MSARSDKGGCGCLLLLIPIILIIGLVNSCSGHEHPFAPEMPETPVATQPVAPSTTDGPYGPLPPEYPPVTTDPTTEPPLEPETTTEPPADGGGDVDIDPPGNGYLNGPGVNCGIHGCHAHVLPHFGWHF